MRFDFDLIVIGGGSGGLAAAFRAAEHGARVALLEPADLGGTCVNAGCVPKKAMWLAAEVGRQLAFAEAIGFAAQDRALDWPVFVAHRQRYIGNIHASYQRRLDKAGIALLPMRARLVDPHTVECEDGVRLCAPRLLLATGGHAVKPKIPGAELGGVSDDFFHWTAPPSRVALVGWIATVSCRSSRVMPSFSATAKPCRISSAASPSRLMPTTRRDSPRQTSLNRLRCGESASACSIGRKLARVV